MNHVSEIRKKNLLDIIRIIHHSDKITKAEIVAKTDLTLVTVNKLVNSLLKKNIVFECGAAQSSGGRKASQFSFNHTIYYMIGLNIEIGAYTIVISDLNHVEIKRAYQIIQEGKQVEDTIDKIISSVQFALKETHLSEKSVAAIGITVPGPVDIVSGTIRLLPNWRDWHDVHIARFFKAKFGFPVFVEKDTYSAIRYLRNIGEIAPNRSAVYINIGGGIGASILISDKVYRGFNDVAGEIGHISVEADGPKCNCGNFGCLEVFSSDQSIVRQVKKYIKSGVRSSVIEMIDGEIENLTIQHIIDAALQSDELSHSVLLKAARYLGIGISNIIKTYDPADIIIDCSWIRQIDSLFSEVIEISNLRTTIFQKGKIRIRRLSLDDIFLNGALSLVLDYLFKDEIDSVLIKRRTIAEPVE